MQKLSLEQINEIEKLQLTQAELMYLRLRSTKTLQEIGDLLGVSRQWAAQVIGGAMLKLEEQKTWDTN